LLYKGIEDQLNWHGKALGKESANALKAIKENIVNQGPHGLKPSSPTSVAPVVNIKNIKLSEPPNYQKGQAVRQCIYTIPSSYHHLLNQAIF
jgi:transketolase